MVDWNLYLKIKLHVHLIEADLSHDLDSPHIIPPTVSATAVLQPLLQVSGSLYPRAHYAPRTDLGICRSQAGVTEILLEWFLGNQINYIKLPTKRPQN